ncbi:HAD-IIB family hydrolase [Opitutus sp. ER46]|uniref:HAD-IIB family hydrolase n=1 Tax=Opitutus sp. ER46 TaxID=2161864 RepID=UPI000D2FECAA|nr:HAD-IIB family hydrolase [Opitutus sp. ER46]PTX96639.1 glycogen debranching protein [Opitutus sp. ER46]
MTPAPAPSIRLFSSDLDGTLLGNPESTLRFKQAWEALPRETRPLLVYNSGRSVTDTRALVLSRRLPEPDYIIGGVGTELYNHRTHHEEPAFNAQFGEGWDLAKVEAIMTAMPGVERQPPEFLHPYKSSWYLHRADRAKIDELRRRFESAGLQVNVVYSSLRDLDVLPSRANKGNALAWLCARLNLPLTSVLVAGDTGNDSAMFLLPGVHGIVVENAQPELFESVVKLPTFVSRNVMADGVLEGLKHFGVIPQVPVGRGLPSGQRHHAAWRGMLFAPETFRTLHEEERALIATGYEQALATLRRNITPLGFSACSLADNTVTGTDANYRSVWARDGCFTVVQTIEMDDPDLRDAQRRTLRTLLDTVAPNGQVPANVRIDDGTPEYSGVGGICSIDSGLWLILAVYHYVTETGDLALLTEYAPTLRRTMEWLSAQDSNNDGLIEVPEAGDWTDLFGRSYHVLYDEVLWYRANVCYGRLLEYQQDFDRAAEFLRWSQHIAGKIKASFWPSTARDPKSAPTFADRQASLGDAQYLIAEITPFAFNWRCDVIGNLLAFLTNVIDVDRARTAFRFMWGVGVNNPYPVANLYPAVQSGDPDWRPYYTVNLLNLPHHYHNGGHWPFIGGLWVRFIHRLGLHDLARHELVKLAEVNRLGRNREWEFNEWVHGVTGRPMGKAYQAWSAAAYLRACQELHLDSDAAARAE